jgi:4-hydroxybenzoate polyprenyltransferase
LNRAWLTGVARLVHPYPSLLNALVVGVLASVAGAPASTSVRLAASMAALQFSIGALNDLIDAPADAGRGGRKPIPAQVVAPSQARWVVVAGLVAGLLLAAPSGPVALGIGAGGATLGYLYNLRLKGTPFAWAPLAGAIPLIPLFAWTGAGAQLPISFLVLLPAGALAGAGLAIGNALGDLERDLASGTPNVAARLGHSRAWWIHAGLHAGVILVASGGALLLPGGDLRAAGVVAAAGLVVVVGVVAARGGGAVRDHAWELEAAGTGLLGVVWLLAVGA